MRISFASLRKESNVSRSGARSSVAFRIEASVAVPEIAVGKMLY